MDLLESTTLSSGPYAGSSERAALAAALASPLALAEIAVLSKEDFSEPLDAIFGALKTAYEYGATPSRELLRDHITNNEVKPEFGPILEVLDRLEPKEEDPKVVRSLVDEIQERSRRRKLASLTRKASGSLMDGSASAQEVMYGLIADASDLVMARKGDIQHVKAAIESYDYGFQAVVDPTRGPEASATGIPGLDRMLGGGFRPGELIILGARPSVGKTSMALCLAKEALDRNRSVLLFSMEMTFMSLVQRLLCLYGSIPYAEFQRGPHDEKDHERLRGALMAVVSKPLYGDDTKSLDPAELVLRVKRFVSRNKVDLIIVDYLQLMSSKGKVENRTQEVSKISRSLKILAMELGIPVLALSQLSRGIESRRGPDRKPKLSDLRESGSLEQDADIVLFLHRDAVYDRDADPYAAEIIVSKQRNGPTGTVPLRFRGELMKFEEPSYHYEDDDE